MRAPAVNPVLQKYKVPQSNVFLMTRFAKTPHHNEISNTVAQAVEAFGLEFIRADDTNLSVSDLWRKVEFCMKACEYGVAVFETIDTSDFNPNVSLELGYMLALERKCLLLKEKRLGGLMADLRGFLHKEFDCENIHASILGQVADWLQEVGVRRQKDERVVVFVSAGGTCRCAMSKAVSRHLLDDRKVIGGPLRFESRAASSPSRESATDAAIKVVMQTLGQDLLSDHRPRRMGVGFLYEADLILATDRAVLAAIHTIFDKYPGSESDKKHVEAEIRRKSFLLSEFFGSTGDIPDPWPDRNDAESLARYEACITHLRNLVAPKLDKLTEFRSKAPQIAFGTSHLST